MSTPKTVFVTERKACNDDEKYLIVDTSVDGLLAACDLGERITVAEYQLVGEMKAYTVAHIDPIPAKATRAKKK